MLLFFVVVDDYKSNPLNLTDIKKYFLQMSLYFIIFGEKYRLFVAVKLHAS